MNAFLATLRQRRPSSFEIAILLISLGLLSWYNWLLDDAYIYFRYVDNLVIFGQGLVYNPGEYVEGFSSPLWVLLLTLLRAMHANYMHAVIAIGLLSCAAIWSLSVLTNRQLIPGSDEQHFGTNMPLVYLLLNYGVLSYFTSGVETPLVLLMGACYAAAVLIPRNIWLQVAIGLAPAIRHELFIPYAMLLVWLWLHNHRLPWAALVSCGVTLGGYEAFRIWYYADLFPLTFYLKNEQLWSQGLLYLGDTFLTYYTPLYLLLAAALYFFAARFHDNETLRLKERLFMLLLALPILIYVTRIGGDGRHLRYLAFPFVLIILSTGGLLEAVLKNCSAGVKRGAGVWVILLAIATINFYPPQLSVHPARVREAGRYHTMVNNVNDAALHRTAGWIQPFWREQLPSTQWGWQFGSAGALEWRAAVERYGDKATYGNDIAESWCKSAYIMAPAYVVHSLGLTEPYLARTRVAIDRPAHKYGLEPLADELLAMRQQYGFGPGALGKAIAAGQSADWLAGNEAAVEAIERRVFNTHSFTDNLRTAFSGSAWIYPDEAQPTP